ncbi:hypothetical protein FORC37_2776 [Vibrio vulnificus]|nr:hypothetical protein FORC37_2776 [Vibrio vulnificus]
MLLFHWNKCQQRAIPLLLEVLVLIEVLGSMLAAGVSIGAKIQQGQYIAYVGKVVLKSGWTGEMLHLEIYDGSATGILRAPLSESPYQRRKDLINPTDILNMAQKRLPS